MYIFYNTSTVIFKVLCFKGFLKVSLKFLKSKSVCLIVYNI